MDPLCLVLRNSHGQYCTIDDTWSDDANDAFPYGSMVAFGQASDYDARVYLRFPSGKEIEVFEGDFNTDEVYRIARERTDAIYNHIDLLKERA